MLLHWTIVLVARSRECAVGRLNGTFLVYNHGGGAKGTGLGFKLGKFRLNYAVTNGIIDFENKKTLRNCLKEKYAFSPEKRPVSSRFSRSP